MLLNGPKIGTCHSTCFRFPLPRHKDWRSDGKSGKHNWESHQSGTQSWHESILSECEEENGRRRASGVNRESERERKRGCHQNLIHFSVRVFFFPRIRYYFNFKKPYHLQWQSLFSRALILTLASSSSSSRFLSLSLYFIALVKSDKEKLHLREQQCVLLLVAFEKNTTQWKWMCERMRKNAQMQKQNIDKFIHCASGSRSEPRGEGRRCMRNETTARHERSV